MDGIRDCTVFCRLERPHKKLIMGRLVLMRETDMKQAYDIGWD